LYAGLNPGNSAQCGFEKSLSYFNSSKYEKAVMHFSRATELDPEFAKAYLYLRRLSINMSERLNALNPIRTTYGLSPTDIK
jgi:tetratricopeptide (TPR) repeat protein